MEWIIIIIVVGVIIAAIVKGDQKPKKPGRLSFSDAVNLLTEEHVNEKKQVTSDDELYNWVKNNPDNGTDEWLNKASEFIVDENSDMVDNILLYLEEYTENDDSIELPIRGINFRDLDENDICILDGYIMADKENKYDKYAIGVYGNDGTHFGFIEKGQKALYNKIEEVGGLINVGLDINTFIDEDKGEMRFHGIVTIDKNDLS